MLSYFWGTSNDDPPKVEGKGKEEEWIGLTDVRRRSEDRRRMVRAGI
jgi:hypothetical protein